MRNGRESVVDQNRYCNFSEPTKPLISYTNGVRQSKLFNFDSLYYPHMLQQISNLTSELSIWIDSRFTSFKRVNNFRAEIRKKSKFPHYNLLDINEKKIGNR